MEIKSNYFKEPVDYKVLITTSGVGSRLGALTNHTNKCLIPVGQKNSLAHIIESYPLEVTFVVTLGHFAEHVREFIEISYPDRLFEFIEVPNYEGPGSSLALSMLAAKNYLQQPFIFHASDTLIDPDPVPPPTSNWIFGFKNIEADNYATFDVQGIKVSNIYDKGMTEFDFIHIGLVGIFDYLEFWAQVEEIIKDNSVFNPTDVNVIRNLIKNGIEFSFFETKSWLDIGNSSALLKAKERIGNSFITLPKVSESVSFIGNSVVKFFSDSNINKNRVQRVRYLDGLVPNIEASTNHFLRYEYIPGEVISRATNAKILGELLGWAQKNLWIPKVGSINLEFKKKCEEFYFNKSLERLNFFISTRGISDKETIINGLEVPSAYDLLINSKNYLIQNIIETGFHGDFILDNIIYKDKKFTLIDWRQEFSGDLQFGDKYYDLAKLNHSLHVNHDIVSRKLFEISNSGREVICTILRKDTHVEMQTELNNFILQQNLSKQKIDILTSVIWINMSPLHHHPFDLFLYNYGRYFLWRAING